MPWPFDRAYMQLALYAGLVVGAVAPLVGTFLVQKRLSLMGDGIGHVAFAGVAIGLLTGVWPVWSALVVAVVAAVAMDLLRRRGLAGDLVLALFFYSGIAAAVVMASWARSLDVSILPYLFGALLVAEPAEVWLVAGLGVAIVGVVAVAGRALFATILDEESARVAGLPVDGLNVVLSVLVALTVVVAMRAVGLLLVAALMVLPVGAAQALARSFRGTMIGASLIGMGSVVAGLTIARVAPVAPGGTIVLVAAALFVIASLFSRQAARLVPRALHEPHEIHRHPQ